MSTLKEEIQSAVEKLTSIDTAITGDEERGVIGMKQHIEKIYETTNEHSVKFESFEKRLSEAERFKTKVEKVSKWTIGTFLTAVGAIIIAGIKDGFKLLKDWFH